MVKRIGDLLRGLTGEDSPAPRERRRHGADQPDAQAASDAGQRSAAGAGERPPEGEKNEESEQHPRLAPDAKPVRARDLSVEGAALRATIVVIGVLLVLETIFRLEMLVLIVVVAIILAAAMHMPVLGLERRGVPRLLAIVLAYVGLLVGFIVLFGLVGAPLASQLHELSQDFPMTVDDFRTRTVEFMNALLPGTPGEQIVGVVTDALRQVDIGRLLDVPLLAFEIVTNVVIILFLSALLVLERDRARGWLMPLVAADEREDMLDVARGVLNRLGAFVRGQLAVMSTIGVAMFVGASLLGVPFALPLAVIAFVTEAIPMVGPWLALVPAVILGFSEGPVQGVGIIVFWLVVQQIESYVLTPAVMGKVEQVSPVVVLLAILAGFELLGIIGALIAVPVVAAAGLIFNAVIRPARRRQLGDRV